MRRWLMSLGVLFVLWPALAGAHHNKGLPHYGYFENYPQVPTEEYVVVEGRWEFGGTIFNFQGLDRRTADTPNDVKIYLYLYDLELDGPYAGPVDFEVLLDGEVVTRFQRGGPDEERIYITRETLPESGTYDLVARLRGPVAGAVTLSFDIELADEINWLLVILLLGPVGLVFGLAVLGRSRRGRARLGRDAPVTSLAAAPAIDCADPNSAIGALNDATVAQAHIMDGMPPLLFVAGFAAIIVATFVVVELVGARPPSRWRKNLIRRRWLYERVRSRWFQAIPQLGMVLVLVGLLYAGLAGSRVRNVTPVAVWTVWWAGLVFMVALVGPLFCFACPWDGLANLVSRLRLAARVEPLSLGITVPGWLRTMYPAIALFVLLSWAELGLGTTTDPRQTAYLGLGMVGLAVTGALLFDGKAFCRGACPVGRISGVYANFAPVEIRARNPKTCRSCKTEDCLNGNARGYPCPTGISLKTTTTATDCTLCTECVKSCDRYNVAFNLRPFAADLHGGIQPRRDEAWMALVLLALTLFHGLSMTTTWENPLPGRWSLMRWMTIELGLPPVGAFTVGMAVVMAAPVALYWLACLASARWTRGAGVTAGALFSRFAFALLPVALFYHLAHNAMHLLMEGGHLIPLLSDPMGDGSDYLGTASVRLGHLVDEGPLWWIQVGLILVGHIFGVLVAHRIARGLFRRARDATRALIPVTAVMVLVSAAGLTLMVLDMHMRLGRS